jgi:hypothetical protein
MLGWLHCKLQPRGVERPATPTNHAWNHLFPLPRLCCLAGWRLARLVCSSLVAPRAQCRCTAWLCPSAMLWAPVLFRSCALTRRTPLETTPCCASWRHWDTSWMWHATRAVRAVLAPARRSAHGSALPFRCPCVHAHMAVLAITCAAAYASSRMPAHLFFHLLALVLLPGAALATLHSLQAAWGMVIYRCTWRSVTPAPCQHWSYYALGFLSASWLRRVLRVC